MLTVFPGVHVKGVDTVFEAVQLVGFFTLPQLGVPVLQAMDSQLWLEGAGSEFACCHLDRLS